MLDDLFPDRWTKPDCNAANQPTEAQKCYCEIGQATGEALDDQRDAIEDLRKQLELWPQIGSAARRLDATARSLRVRTPHGDPPIKTDSLTRAGQSSQPEDADDALERLNALREQQAAVEEWRIGWELYKEAKTLHAELGNQKLTDAERKVLADNHPEVLRQTDLWPATSAADLESGEVVRRLRDTVRNLRAVAAAHQLDLRRARSLRRRRCLRRRLRRRSGPHARSSSAYDAPT